MLRMSNDYCFRGIPEKWDPEPEGETQDPGPLGGNLGWGPKLKP